MIIIRVDQSTKLQATEENLVLRLITHFKETAKFIEIQFAFKISITSTMKYQTQQKRISRRSRGIAMSSKNLVSSPEVMKLENQVQEALEEVNIR